MPKIQKRFELITNWRIFLRIIQYRLCAKITIQAMSDAAQIQENSEMIWSGKKTIERFKRKSLQFIYKCSSVFSIKSSSIKIGKKMKKKNDRKKRQNQTNLILGRFPAKLFDALYKLYYFYWCKTAAKSRLSASYRGEKSRTTQSISCDGPILFHSFREWKAIRYCRISQNSCCCKTEMIAIQKCSDKK